MKKLLKLFKEKSRNCKLNTKESRARKGAYVDCIVELEKVINNTSFVEHDLEKIVNKDKEYILGFYTGDELKKYLSDNYA